MGNGMERGGRGGEGPAERAEGDTSGEEGGIGRPRTKSRGRTEAPSTERERDMAQGKAVRGRMDMRLWGTYTVLSKRFRFMPRMLHEIKGGTRVCHVPKR